MKVIDMLDRIAKGEKVDFRVIDDIGYYCEENQFLHNEYGEEVEWIIDSSWLNKEVEVIEEDKKIEKVNTYVLCDSDFERMGVHSLKVTEIIDKAFEEYSHKINEIIDKLEEK